MPVSPNVTSSELKGEMSKRAIAQCRTAPMAKNSGTITSSVSSGSMPIVAIW